MNEDRWKRIEWLVEQALELTPDDRTAFIQKECGTDGTLRKEIHSLLQHQDKAFTFINDFEKNIVEPFINKMAYNRFDENQRINTKIGHYRITEIIGKGGMGVVYKAKDTKLDRIVALKFLPSHLTRSKKDRQRFIREAKAAAALNHPNICTIHSVEDYDGQHFISMEYIDGQTLLEKLESEDITPEEALEYSIRIAEALTEAHEKSIVHRDIKPGNIMLNSKGRIKVTDFGLAKFQTGSKITKEGITMGTVYYMSPEQADGKKVDHRTDIWSLGVVINEMLTGKRPFGGANDQAVIYSILNKAPESLTALKSSLPIELEQIVKKALAKHPAERYQHVDEMLADLKVIQSSLESRENPTLTVKTKLRGKNRAYIYSSVSSLLVLVILFFYYFLPQRSEVINSVAVLPLTNLMDDTEQEYFVQGMHDALINELSKISALKVISRTSTMRYDQTTKPLPQIASELNVNGVIQGSVLREGDQVRISVQLIHGPTDENLWTNTYHYELRNVMTLYNEVARAVAEQIQITVAPEEAEHLTSAEEVNPAAYEDYLRGRYHWNKLTPEGWEASIDDFERSIQKDPSYAPAYAMMSLAYSSLGYYSRISPSVLHSQALAAAEHAVALDSRLAEAHASLAMVKLSYDWDWTAADRASQKALNLNPNSAMALIYRAFYLNWVGRHDEAIAVQKRAVELDPVAPWTNSWLGAILFMSRRYDEAIEQLNKVVELEPDYREAHLWLCFSYAKTGRYEDATRECDLSSVSPSSFGRQWREVWILGMVGKSSRAHQILEQIPNSQNAAPNERYFMAAALGEAGEADRAIRLLEDAYHARSALLSVLKVDPRIDALRDNPRFQDLLQRMNFPE